MTGPAAQASSSGAGRFTNLRRLRRTPSTNTVALEAAAAGTPEGLVVVAHDQTAGRGRLGRPWVAPPGAALLCSVLLRPPEAASAFLLMASVTLAARAAAGSLAGVALGCKWPNDLLAGEEKVAGVLAERAPDGAVVVGIGCNVSEAPDGGYPPGATCLEAVAGRPVALEPLLGAFLVELESRYGRLVEDPDLGRTGLLKEARAASATLGRPVRVELPGGEVVEGTAAELRDDGRLVVVRRGAGPLVVEVGDVVHLRHGPGDAPPPAAPGGGGRVP